MKFVPANFEPPQGFATDQCAREPLGPKHNEGDYAAWSSSIDHIRSTPGFDQGTWPREMTLEENRRTSSGTQPTLPQARGSRTRSAIRSMERSSGASTSI